MAVNHARAARVKKIEEKRAEKEKKSRFKKFQIRKDQEEILESKPQGFNKNYVIGQSRLRDPELEMKLLAATIVPVPKLDPFWKVTSVFLDKRKRNARKSMFGNEFNQTRVDKLKDLAKKTPGSVRLEVQKMLKSHPRERDLYMLSAVCTNRMLKNTRADIKDVVDGMVLGVIDGAIGVVSDGLSINNLQNFFEVYFAFLEKLKRYQERTYDLVRNDTGYGPLRMNLAYALQITDLLYEKQEACLGMLAVMAKNFNKSSLAHVRFDFLSLNKAVNYINAGMPTKKLGDLGTAEEFVNNVLGMLQTLVKVPLLDPLVDQISKHLSTSKPGMRIKIVGIHSARLFFEFKLAIILRDMENMKILARRLFKLNLAMIRAVKNRTIAAKSEFEPYLNLGTVVEFSINLFPKQEQEIMVKTAIKILERTPLLDTTDDRRFAKQCDQMAIQLDAMAHGDLGLRMDPNFDPFRDEAAAGASSLEAEA